jgi:CubicO group peptidase (beta-lactamase class C family)
MMRLIIFFASIVLCASTGKAQESLSEDLDKLLQPYMLSKEPGGVVLVAKKGSVVYKKAFGMANLELNVPVNDSMIFYIGSNTKQFTAVSILQLVEKGKLDLKDSIGKFIACPFPVSSITIEQFLSHTSGLGSNNETPAYKLIDRKGVTAAELVKYFTNLPMDFPAGTRWAYNNSNFYMLGYLVEKLTGQSYADYVTEHIFKPAGMHSTYMGKETSIIKNRPSGYTNFRLGIFNSRISTVELLYSSGGIQSTVDDMLKWNRALNTGKLLRLETLQHAYQPQTLTNGKQTTYGMGFHLQDLRKSPALRHGGLVEGFTSETLYLPNEDVYVVILLNEETFKIPIVPLARIIAGLAINKPYSYTEVAFNKDEVGKYTGLYENALNEFINIGEQNGKLTFQRPNGTLYPMYYAGNNEFFLDKDLIRTEFTIDNNGKIKSQNTSQAGVGITEWFKTQRPSLNLAKERVADSLLKLYIGNYVSADHDTIKVSRDGPALYYKVGNHPKLLLGAENNNRFIALKEEFRLEFKTDPVTKIPALLYTKGRKSKKFVKIEK